jgi:hypothetical protein
MANKNHQENARTRIVKICKDIYKWVVVRPTFMAAFVILEGVFLKNENNTTESWREGSSYWGQRPHRPHWRTNQPLREWPDKALLSGAMEPIQEEALKQVETGADILNVSVNAFGIHEDVVLPRVIVEIMKEVDVPF